MHNHIVAIIGLNFVSSRFSISIVRSFRPVDKGSPRRSTMFPVKAFSRFRPESPCNSDLVHLPANIKRVVPSFAIGLSEQGIRWGIGKAPTIHAVILFAVPPSAEQAYVSLIVTFAKFLNDEGAFHALRQCAEPGEVLALLKHVQLVRTGPQLGVDGY